MWPVGVQEKGSATSGTSIDQNIIVWQQGESACPPAGPGRALVWWSTVESCSWCLEAPVTGHGMHLATSNEENPMPSSPGAAGGAGAPARRPPARTAHRQDWARVEAIMWVIKTHLSCTHTRRSENAARTREGDAKTAPSAPRCPPRAPRRCSARARGAPRPHRLHAAALRGAHRIWNMNPHPRAQSGNRQNDRASGHRAHKKNSKTRSEHHAVVSKKRRSALHHKRGAGYLSSTSR